MTRNVYVSPSHEAIVSKIQSYAKREGVSFSEAILKLAEKALKK